MKTAFDAIIVGGGPAGATAAILLARAGWSVAIVEQHVYPRRKVCGECIAAPNLPLFDQLGVGEAFDGLAGPELLQVLLMAGEATVAADLPACAGPPHAWGRVLGRDYLDALLLDRASGCGAHVWQPWRVERVTREADGCSTCRLVAAHAHARASLSAPIMVAANGSWESDPFAVGARHAHRGSDLLAFKGNYLHASLAPGLLPVLAFPGGYGGMVLGDHGRITFAFCVRRDLLRRCRAAHPGIPAAMAAREYVQRQVAGVRAALADAEPDAAWLTVGPIRPGIRSPWRGDGIFAVGNAAGEAHPILGEGISMAVQSAWLLCDLLTMEGHLSAGDALDAIGREYDRRWRRHFTLRVACAALFAHAAMHGHSASALLALLRRWPGLLTHGARAGGKVRRFRKLG